MNGKNNLETPKNIWIDEFVCLRSKMCSFKCGDNSENKLQGNSKSQSKHIKFEEYRKCVDGEEYRNECFNYIFRSISLEMYLHEVKKSTLSIFDGKRIFFSNIKSLPRNLKIMVVYTVFI